jgi:hypothetical protein
MASDSFSRFSDSPSAPARRMFAITPHDTAEVDPLPKAIRADGDGTVTLRAAGSDADVTVTMTAGEILPVRARHIRAGGTTVAAIHGLA